MKLNWKTLTRVVAHDVEFEQQQSPTGTVHTNLTAGEPGIYTWVHREGNVSRTILHYGVSVTANEYVLPGFDEPTVRIDVQTDRGGEHSVTFMNTTATQLIEALEAARMANTPEALLESAQ